MQMLRAILSNIINRKRMSHERRLNVVLGVRVRGRIYWNALLCGVSHGFVFFFSDASGLRTGISLHEVA